MNEFKTNFTGEKNMMHLETSQFALIDKVQLMRAFDPDAGALYSRVKSLKLIDPDDNSFNQEVESLSSTEFRTVGQLFNLFRI